MAVFLINLTRDNIEDKRFQHECLAIGYLTASLENSGISVKHVDCQLYDIADETIIEQILEWDPLVVGISAGVQETFPHVINFIKRLRDTGYTKHITAGGVFGSIAAGKILDYVKEIDSVCIGEGETVLVSLVNSLKANEKPDHIEGLAVRNKTISNTDDIFKKIVYNKDLDLVHFPSRRDVPRLKELGRRISIVASRGCVGNCVFCSSQSLKCMGLPRRQRTARNVTNEMYYLYKEYGVRRIRFNDPVFIAPGSEGENWGFDFCDRLAKIDDYQADFVINLRSRECANVELMKRMAQVGLKKVVLGVESGSDDVLRWMRKPTTVELNNKAILILKELGINVEICFIFFVPVMKISDVVANIKFLQNHDAINPFYLTSLLEVYSGSRAEEILLAGNNLQKDHWWDLGRFTFTDQPMLTFWKLIKPVINDYGKVIEKLHQLDIVAQKRKSDDSGQEISVILNKMTAKCGSLLRDAYMQLIEIIGNNNEVIESSSTLKEFNAINAARASDLDNEIQNYL